MRVRFFSARLACFAVVLTALPLAARAGDPAQCKLDKVAEIPVELRHGSPFTQTLINGVPARVLLDTGAWKSIVMPGFAKRLNLPITTIAGAHGQGVGGSTRIGRVTLDSMEMGDWQARDVTLLVTEDTQTGQSFDIILGRDVLNQADIELDYAHNAIRLFHAQGCEDVPLAYWAQTFAQAEMHTIPGQLAPNEVRVTLNDGVTSWALLDTGASGTLLDRRLASRAGVSEDSPGVVEGGLSGGIGKAKLHTHIANFDSISIGDETIHNVRLRFAEWGDHDAQQDSYRMILGGDFILAHRIMIARDQGKIYFTNVSPHVFTPQEKKPADPHA